MNSKFKVGNTVHVVNKSWSRVLNVPTAGDHIPDTYLDGTMRKFEILAVDACIPVQKNGACANTLLLDKRNGEIITINDCNIFTEPVITIHFISNGQDITDEMSEKSRQAVLKANIN